MLYPLVKCRLFFEERRVKKRYYSNTEFRAIDRTLLQAYRFKNPYTISRKFLEKRGEREIHLYGETYLTTYEKIAHACQLNQDDRLLELGSGRGRGAFFLSTYFGARVHGVEWISEFVNVAKEVASRCHCTRVTFSCEDFMQTPLEGYSVIYLFGTALPDDQIRQLARRFLLLPSGVTIITVSYPLTEYHPSFTSQKEMRAQFPWGETEIYIQEVP